VKFKSDNVYALELENGARVLAVPADDANIRGLTVNGWIVADEAARLKEDLIVALHPMRARCPQARFAMLSTVWTRTDYFWTQWTSKNANILRLKVIADSSDTPFTREFLDLQRHTMSEQDFNREYLGIPGGGEESPFTWELFERATEIHRPSAPLGAAFRPPADPSPVPVTNPFRNIEQME